MIVRLDAHGWSLGLRPDLGGAAAFLRRNGRDVLRAAPEDADDPLQMGCFPLVPFANRIAQGRFSFEGRTVRLPVQSRFAPHALHGTGWTVPWSVEAEADDAITLACEHPPGDWPWAFTARQKFTLTSQAMRIELSVRNASNSRMPAGLGLHPFFPIGPEARLRLRSEAVWLSGETLIPTVERLPAFLFDWSDNSRIADAPFIDHCYAGWDGSAALSGSDGTVDLTAHGADHVHVFAPPGDDFICIEPVTHRPDAINGPEGMAALAPGETRDIALTIRAR